MLTTVCDATLNRTTAEDVATIKYKDFITDFDALAVALYGGDANEAVKYLALPPDDPVHIAAAKARDFRYDADGVRMAASLGFWEENLAKLLAVAKADPLHGAKLVQVFVHFLDRSDNYHLSPLLVTRLLCYVDKRAQRDGFLITRQNGDTIHETVHLREVG